MNIYIGGPNICKVGGLPRKECKNLICRSCGIRVLKFDGYEWDEDKINYLFFRSNFGDFERLKKGMLYSPEKSVYSCGCKGVTVKNGLKIESYEDWNCTGCPI